MESINRYTVVSCSYSPGRLPCDESQMELTECRAGVAGVPTHRTGQVSARIMADTEKLNDAEL